MAWELEGLIAHLLMVISCAGERGCSVQELLQAIRDSLAPPGTSAEDCQGSPPDQAASEAWKWLVQRSDVSVGREREHNHLTLPELLSLQQLHPLASSASHTASHRGPSQAPEGRGNGCSSSEGEIRVRTLEATMWETIAGHAVDHKRVPRSEWLLLLGIASTKSEGILQGDLGRLVDQDKRSVPKRTDCLVKKGYIVKRTTLIRGTKTSKMWLRTFAPPLPRETDPGDEPKAEMNLSRQTLTDNLDPVPWRIRWTGPDIDYKALATTIMALAKEWDVIRVSDLKEKLGILGMRWQMKIVSKTCRFLNSRGAIKYVAAQLEDRVFKDCIKFAREMTAEDWSIYLSTGKHPKKPARGSEHMAFEENIGSERLNLQRAHNARLAKCPPWSLDKPLPQAMAQIVQSFGDLGLSNPDIYTLTLGATFNRYLSSMTGSLSTADIQPPHLKHLQMRSEHVRTGKVASYLFYLPPALNLAHNAASYPEGKAKLPRNAENWDASASAGDVYGFFSATAVPKHPFSSLAAICGLKLSRKQDGRGKRPSTKQPIQGEGQQLEDDCSGEPSEGVLNMDKAEAAQLETCPETSDEQSKPRQCSGRPVTLKLSPDTLRLVMEDRERSGSPTSRQGSSRRHRVKSSSKGPGPVTLSDSVGSRELDSRIKEDDALSTTTPTSGRKQSKTGRPQGRPAGPGRGRDRSKQDSSARYFASSPRPWKCEKCGGSWRNDIGLKYHLEKSRSTCNPSYTPALAAARKKKQSSFFQPRASSPSSEKCAMVLAGSDSPRPDRLGIGMLQESSSIPMQSGQGEEHVSEQVRDLEATPKSGKEEASGSSPVVDWNETDEERSCRSPQFSHAGVLLQDEPIVSCYTLALDSHQNLPGSPAAGPWREEYTADPGPLVSELNAEEAVPISDTMQIEDEMRQASVTDEPSEPVLPGSDSQNAKNKDNISGTTKPKQPASRDVQSMSQKASGASIAKQKKTPRDRICDMIDTIVSENNGVLLGGKSLWHAVTAEWQPDIAGMPLPSSRACQAAVYTMIRKKVLTEHWHAFRDRKGHFAKCQLILRPGIDPFSPESMFLVDMAKDALAHANDLPQVDHSDNTESHGKHRVRGRRLLPNEIAILDAPVYAAQAAAKRAAAFTEGSHHRPQRAKYSTRRKRGDVDGFASSPELQAPKRIRFAVVGTDRRVSDMPGDPLPSAQSAASISFLEPNRYLYDEIPSPQYEPPPMPIDPQLIPEEARGLTPPQISLSPARPDAYVFDAIKPIFGSCGNWPELHYRDLERLGTSFTLNGWIPDRSWFRWASLGREIEKRFAAREARASSSRSPRERFVNGLRACEEVEAAWKTHFINAVPGEAGPHNIFISCPGQPDEYTVRLPSALHWFPPEQFALSSPSHAEEASSSDEEPRAPPVAEKKAPKLAKKTVKFAAKPVLRQPKIKRVALVSRALTAIPAQNESTEDGARGAEDSTELMAAFIAVRSLLGGAEKAIDWGLLALIFPHLGLRYLRRFWVTARKEQSAYISNFTRVFQERLISALDKEELPMLDYENPLDYDWDNLIQWTMQLPRQEGLQLPPSRDSLDKQYLLEDMKATDEDWREKFFNNLSSFFSRYEAVSSEPGTITVGQASQGLEDVPLVDDLAVARSWIKSLCSTAETKYSADQLRSRFLQLAAPRKQRRSELLKEAAAQLGQQLVIRREKRPLPLGRPYRLNEWYLSMLARLAQSSKYSEAAAFKEELDSAFRHSKALRVPYTLNDGAMMALTNLNAAGRIRLVPLDLPDIPFGFEPGNYESRKTPKSCYHFGLEATPTATYEYNEDIVVLRNVVREALPLGGPRGELPQWIDLFGESNVPRWSELLGALCFAFATRGSMTVEGICGALNPLLDAFEAHLLMSWGKRTGVLTSLVDGVGTTVGDWWWLAVPWARRHAGGQAGAST